MTRKEAIINLVTMLGIGIILALILTGGKSDDFLLTAILSMICAGVPTGWKLITKIIVPVSLMSVIFVFFLSMLVGIIAFPVGVVRDIYYIVKNKQPANEE